MTSRDAILASIRKHSTHAVDLPPADGPWIQFADRQSQFSTMLESVGGVCVQVKSIAEINAELARLPAFSSAKAICSRVANVGTPNVDLETIADPHELESIDFAILPGEFGVAENGAVWITEAAVPHRAVYFIVQHLALVVPADRIVDNMHEAYRILCGHYDARAARFQQAGFETFISGPSKTADIEQSLVIGAHGPRSLTVFLLG